MDETFLPYLPQKIKIQEIIFIVLKTNMALFLYSGHNQLMRNIYSKRTFRNVLSALSGENSRYGVKIVERLGWDGMEVVTGITANNPPTHKHGSISAPVVFGVLVAKGSSVFRVDVIKFIRRKTNGFDG